MARFVKAYTSKKLDETVLVDENGNQALFYFGYGKIAFKYSDSEDGYILRCVNSKNQVDVTGYKDVTKEYKQAED